MKVSLEEALKRAYEAPFTCKKGDESALGVFFDIEKNGKHVGCGGAGDMAPKAVDLNRCTFALLVHAFNHFPEAVDLLERHCTGFSEEGSFVKWHEDLARFLAKASTVELPD